MSQLFASGGHTIVVSASTSVFPMNIQDWFPLGWTGWNFLHSEGLSRVFSNTTVQKNQFFGTPLSSQSNSHIHRVGDAMQPSHPLSPLLLLPSIFPSIRIFSNESALCIRWPNYWSFSFNISPSNEHSGLTSFMMDWLDLLVVQGTLKESSPTPQFKSINYSAFSCLHSPTLTSIHVRKGYWRNHSLD